MTIIESMKLTDGSGTDERHQVRIKAQTNNVDVIVGVCYQLPSQDDKAANYALRN